MKGKEGRDIKNSMNTYKEFFTPAAILVAGCMISLSILSVGGLPVAQGLFAKASDTPADPTEPSEQQEQAQLGPALYERLAQELEVNMEQYTECVAQRRYKDKVEEDMQEGIALGVNGTPGSFINTQPIRGALPYAQVKSLIDAELASGNTELAAGLEVAEEDHIRGNPNAPITLVEFSDFECPFCRRFHPTVQQAMAEYGDQIRWVYKHFPLDQIHPQARPAAEASECIAEQKGDEGFWQFTDAIFKIQES